MRKFFQIDVFNPTDSCIALFTVCALSGSPTATGQATIANAETFDKFAFVNSGVLYENPVLQIGVKAEFNNHLGAAQSQVKGGAPVHTCSHTFNDTSVCTENIL